MDSINPAINELFRAYCSAMELTMRLTASAERMCFDATQDGITPEGLKLCIEARKRFNRANNCQKSLLLHKLLRDEEDRAIVINEIAEEQSRLRKAVVNPAKASVLKAVGRPSEPPETPAQSVGSLKLIEDLKRAAG